VSCASPSRAKWNAADTWDLEARPPGFRLLLADGLGHGADARRAAVIAVRATYGRPGGPLRALEDAHLASRSTRGAAITIADVDLAAGEVRLAGSATSRR
jgi:hypothetical protein